MAQRHYYEAEGETLKQIRKISKERTAAYEKCNQFCEEFGADGFALDGFFKNKMAWLAFPSPPDTKLWRQHKKSKQFWTPRQSTKAGRELRKRMDSIHVPGGSEIADVIGMDCFSTSDGFPAVRMPGMYHFGRRIVIVVHEDVKPKGCKRISDVEFERLRKKYPAEEE